MINFARSSKDLAVFLSGVTFDVNSGEVSLEREVSNTDLPDAISVATEPTPYFEAVPQLQLSLTYACNMSCHYCSFRQRMNSDGRPVNMALETAKKAISFFTDQIGSKSPYARIDFGLTGETFLRRQIHDTLMDSIRQAYEGIPARAVWAGPNTTNGTLSADPEVAHSMGPPQDISCDGPKEVHDAARPYVNGGGTYDDLVKIIQSVLEEHPDIGVTAVLTARHTNFDEIFLHLYETLGFRSIYMKPVNVPPDVDYGLNFNTLPLFITGYTKLIDLILSQKPEKMLSYLLSLNQEDYFMRFFYRIKDRARQIYRCGAGKSGAYVDTDGKLFPCAHFIGKTGWEIGDINSGFDEEKRNRFRVLTVESREPCRSCWARYVCGGGCYYQAVLANGDIASPDLAKCDLIRHLTSEAIRLFTTLATQHPQVLGALPSPFYIRKEYLSASLDRTYLPSAKCDRSGQRRFEITSSGHVQGTILPSSAAATIEIKQGDDELEICLRWSDSIAPQSIRFWFLDLETDPYMMGDLRVAKPEMKGILFCLDENGKLLRAAPAETGVVKKVPYEKLRWETVADIPVVWEVNQARICFHLTKVFSGRIPSNQYGFNLFLGLTDGGQCSLTRYEPFCLISTLEKGDIGPVGGEFTGANDPDDVLNSSPVRGMEPLGRWTGLQANVC